MDKRDLSAVGDIQLTRFLWSRASTLSQVTNIQGFHGQEISMLSQVLSRTQGSCGQEVLTLSHGQAILMLSQVPAWKGLLVERSQRCRRCPAHKVHGHKVPMLCRYPAYKGLMVKSLNAVAGIQHTKFSWSKDLSAVAGIQHTRVSWSRGLNSVAGIQHRNISWSRGLNSVAGILNISWSRGPIAVTGIKTLEASWWRSELTRMTHTFFAYFICQRCLGY
jgi:hypothetical protein